ncbi:hypothetical protein ACWC4J_15760 [Streptomyces sp. NPDC001356]
MAALFRSDVHQYGTFILDMDKSLGLAPVAAMPRPAPRRTS